MQGYSPTCINTHPLNPEWLTQEQRHIWSFFSPWLYWHDDIPTTEFLPGWEWSILQRALDSCCSQDWFHWPSSVPMSLAYVRQELMWLFKTKNPAGHSRDLQSVTGMPTCPRFVCMLVASVMLDSLPTPWTVAHQAPLSMGFSRPEYWSGVDISSSGGYSRPRDWTPISCVSWIAGGFFTLGKQGFDPWVG